MIYGYLENALHVPWYFQAALLAGVLLVLMGASVRAKLAAPGGGVLPDEGITLRNLLEVIVEQLTTLAEDRMGPKWRKYFPLVGTMFFFILLSNLLGLVPGFGGATSAMEATAAWGLIAWVFYTAIGVIEHKGRYLIKFLGPSFFDVEIGGHHIHMRLLAPIFFLLEVPLDMARIATLAIRLFANMFADHTVIGIWLKVVPIGVPAIFMGLGLVICFLQAFIFSLLTMIYIGLALEEPH